MASFSVLEMHCTKRTESITLTIREITPSAIGALIALFERAVGLYASWWASMPIINPAEAGKKAASAILSVRKSITEQLLANPGIPQTASEVAKQINQADKFDWVYKILENLCVNQPHGFQRRGKGDPNSDQFLAC